MPILKTSSRHYYGSLLKRVAFAFVAMVGLSTMAHAENDSFDSIFWQEETSIPCINQPVSIAYSPKTHNYVTVVIEKGGTQYQYNEQGIWGPWGVTNDTYFLDHQHPELGWQIIENGSRFNIANVLYAKGNFIFTYLQTELNGNQDGTPSTDTYPCIDVTPEKSIITHNGFMGGGCMNNIPTDAITPDMLKRTTYIDTDKDGPYYLMILGAKPSKSPTDPDNNPTTSLRYLAIGTQDFHPQAPLQNSYGIITYAGDDEHGYIGLTSDGRTFSGTVKPSTTSPAASLTTAQ